MDDVNLYVETRIRGLRAKKGYYSYVLEALDCDGYPREKDAKKRIRDTGGRHGNKTHPCGLNGSPETV